MTDWTAFVGVALVVVTLMLVLAWLTSDALAGDDIDAEPPSDAERAERDTDTPDINGSGPDGDEPGPGELTTGTLLANVVLTQGLFFGLLIGGLLWTDVPASAIGLTPPGTEIPSAVTTGLGVPNAATTSLGWSLQAITLGTVLGASLYVFNQVGAAAGDRLGVDSSTALREALSPDSMAGWAGLLGVVLPLVATFEELLFRGVLIGGLVVAGVQTGTAVSPWLFVAGSSVAFALGHGAQGRGGIVVTGALGAVLGTAFALTWSLPLVIVAHYVVNAVEFAIHEGLDIDWI